MEWNLISEEDNDFFNDVEVKEVEVKDVDDEGTQENHVLSASKIVSARRAIEILREQKQLEADTWDCFQ